MNTFVPYTNIHLCAQALDNKRLNKQVAECAQIIRQIDCWPNGGWSKHPAVIMWIGFDEPLWLYTKACELERLNRNMQPHAEMSNFPEYDHLTLSHSLLMPDWWGGPIHESHQKVLAAKQAGLPREAYQHLYYWPRP